MSWSPFDTAIQEAVLYRYRYRTYGTVDYSMDTFFGQISVPMRVQIIDADPDLDLYTGNKSRIRIRMERYKSGSGSRTYTVNVQKQAMANN